MSPPRPRYFPINRLILNLKTISHKFHSIVFRDGLIKTNKCNLTDKFQNEPLVIIIKPFLINSSKLNKNNIDKFWGN